MDLPNAPQPGFDAESTATASLSGDERSALKAHLRKCWQLPSGMSAAQSTRVVLRIFLRPDGGLVGEPMLIEASASRDGPRADAGRDPHPEGLPAVRVPARRQVSRMEGARSEFLAARDGGRLNSGPGLAIRIGEGLTHRQ